MPENNVNNFNYQPQAVEDRSYGNNNCGCGFLNGLFGGDSEILFFIIIFLLLFTNFGCCGCNRG